MTPKKNGGPEALPQLRSLRPVTGASTPANLNRWAIVVGISQYRHEPWNLKFAHRDAEDLYHFILSRSGGEFPADHISFLMNEQATTGKITSALRSFLKKPGREDLVLLYFACHGTPDPDRPVNMYLLTHDTDPRDIAGTALPMREIDQALKETLLAERVVIIADTCHSAAIGGAYGPGCDRPGQRDEPVPAGPEPDQGRDCSAHLRGSQ